MFFQKYSIATRIGVVAGIVMLAMLVLVGVEVIGLNSIRTSLNEIVETHFKRQQIVEEIRYLARHGGIIVRNMHLVQSKKEKLEEMDRFAEAKSDYEQRIYDLKVLGGSGQESNLLRDIEENGARTWRIWSEAAENIVMASDTGSENASYILNERVRSLQWEWLDSLEELVELERKLVAESRQRALENYSKTKTWLVVVNVLAIGLGCFLVVVITASIASPLREITRRVDRIASGDLSTRIELRQRGEVGHLVNHINRMVEKLQVNEAELYEYKYNLEELIEWRTGEVNEQRERFISVLIHDLKGPLIPIIGFSRLLMKKRHLTAEQINQYAAAIHDAATKLKFTVEQKSEDLREKRLAYSFDRTPFDMEELLCAVCKGFRPGFQEREIDVRLNGDLPDEYSLQGGIAFTGDIGKVRSVFENLIGNAGKYADSQVEVVLSIKENDIELVVDDDGCGIQQAFRNKIFEEYYQVPGSKDGTGVGLYSVKRVINHYHGDIAVVSSPLGGARFIVRIPIPARHQIAAA